MGRLEHCLPRTRRHRRSTGLECILPNLCEDRRRKTRAGNTVRISFAKAVYFRLGVGFKPTGGFFCVNFATAGVSGLGFYGWDSRDKRAARG
jgi:hypothetical protein